MLIEVNFDSGEWNIIDESLDHSAIRTRWMSDGDL
jgi:hypothetical protein